jgi:hypothetical protein
MVYNSNPWLVVLVVICGIRRRLKDGLAQCMEHSSRWLVTEHGTEKTPQFSRVNISGIPKLNYRYFGLCRSNLT